MQANFVGEQAAAWKAERPADELFILAPHDPAAARRESWSGIEVIRFRYMVPAKWQALAYPAILPNLKRRPWLAAQLLPFLWSEYRAAARIVRQQKIDLIYAHWVMPQGLVAFILNKRLGTPYVLQNHSSDLTVFDRLGRFGPGVAAAIIRGAKRLFVVNSIQREHALSLFPAELQERAAEKVVVLPMGVSPPINSATSSRKVDFATISRLSRKKGIDHFIRATQQLAESGVKFSAAIAGEGEDAEELKALAKSTPIRFAGFLTGEEKESFLNDTRILVVPSVADQGDVEGMPVALLEALCRGKQVIASKDSNITYLPEWAQIEDMVQLLDDPSDVASFTDAMRLSIADDPAKLKRRAERLRAIMARYLWPNLIRTYHQAIPLPR